jgi:Fur family transcriptional regulator, zinc uptake regulator
MKPEKTTPPAPVGFGAHDHAHCKTEAMAKAQAVCEARKLQFTPVRKRVLEILLESHEALGAYDVLARLAAEGLGSKPPVAYRALGFLVEHGFAHRIEKLNAFVACSHPGRAHDAAFMICRDCGLVAEAEPQSPLRQSAGAAGFQIESMVIEAEGLCPACIPEDKA